MAVTKTTAGLAWQALDEANGDAAVARVLAGHLIVAFDRNLNPKLRDQAVAKIEERIRAARAHLDEALNTLKGHH